jgi:hypothetical protein
MAAMLEIDETTATEAGARARLSALALVGAGVGIVVGHLLTVAPDQAMRPYLDHLAEHRTSSTIGMLLTATGAFLVVPGLSAWLRLVRDRGSRLATAGAVLAGVGITALGAGDVMIGLVMGSLVEHHRDTAEVLYHVADTGALLGLPFALAPIFVLGMVLLGAALLRARAVPVWIGVLTIVGAVALPFSNGGGLRAFLTLLPLGIALAGVGVASLRRS